MSTSEIKKYLAIFNEPVVQQDDHRVLTEAQRGVAPAQKFSQKGKDQQAKATANAAARAGADAAAFKPTKGQEVTFDNETYKWLGAQWVSNKTNRTADKAIGKELTNMARGAAPTTPAAPASPTAAATPNPTAAAPAPAGAPTAAPAAAKPSTARKGSVTGDVPVPDNFGNPKSGPAVDPLAEPAQDTGATSIFQNPKLFQDAWAKYTASKPNYQLISDPKMLEVLKSLWMQMGGTKLQESVYLKERDMLIESIARKHPIYESVYDATRYLCEADLSQEQIQQVFKAVADGAAKGMNIDKEGDAPSSNRTFLGKGADATSAAASKISAAWNKVKTSIAQSGPMSGFDTAVDSMQKQIMDKLGGQGGNIGKALTAYRNFAKKNPVMQGAIYAVFTAALAAATGGTGPVALGSIALGLKTVDRLLQGDKASSALWKGFKAGAIAGGGSALFQHLSGAAEHTTSGGAGTEPDVSYSSGAGSGSAIASSMQHYTAAAGDNISTLAAKFHVGVQELMAANPQLTNPNDLAAGMQLNIPASTGSSVYAGGVGTAADTASKVASGAYTPSKYGIKESAYNPYIDWKRTVKSMKLAESKGKRTYTLYVTESGRKEVFRVVHEGIWNGIKTAAKKGWDSATNKITLDKLDMNWRRNYGDNPIEGSVDVDKIKEFLKKQGVKDYLINHALSQIGIETGTATGAEEPTAAATPADTTTDTAAATPADTAAATPASTTSSTGGTTTKTATGLVHKANPNNPNQAAGQTATAPFNDPNSLRSEWEKFTDSGASVSPGVKGVLKDILQQALNTVQEDIEYFKFVSLLK